MQGDVEAALTRLFRTEVQTVGAGRTDAGVHALGQVMSTTDAPERIDVDRVVTVLNAMCRPEIAVHDCRRAPEGFHARFSARSRTYVYAIYMSSVRDPWLRRTALHHPGRLDLGAMNEAAGHLTGLHDFRSFGRPPEPRATGERALYELRCEQDGDLIRIRARANAFLQQMVRSLVGTLIEVGEARRSPDEIPAVLEAVDRAAAGPVAPPHGLCLASVEYESGWSSPGFPLPSPTPSNEE